MPTDQDAGPITIIAPVPWWWRAWLRFSWVVAERCILIKRQLHRLSFIHIAHWGLVSPSHVREPLETSYIVFQSNYDGPAPEYIEAFVYNVSPLIRGIW